MRITTELGSSSVLMLKTVPSAGQAISSSVKEASRLGSLKKKAQNMANTAHTKPSARKLIKAKIQATSANTAKNLSPIGSTVKTQPKHLAKVLLMSSNMAHLKGRVIKRVGRGGLEPPRPCGQQILSLSRLPFRHQPLTVYYFNKKKDACAQFYFLFVKSLKRTVKFLAK